MQARIENPALSVSGALGAFLKLGAVTRNAGATSLADRAEPVADDVWDEAARHYTEGQIGGECVARALQTAAKGA